MKTYKVTTEYIFPDNCDKSTYLQYPKDYVDEFHREGRESGAAGFLPCAKYKKNGKEFIAYACYGTLENPNKNMTFLTLIINKLFDKKGYNDYKEITTKEDLEERAKARAENFRKNSSFVILDFGEQGSSNISETFEKGIINPLK